MAADRRNGKLAVILHADIAGSTGLVRRDERLAHDRIQDAFRRLGDTVAKYRGRVCELRGDALLAEFERASDAVATALAFQIDHAGKNSTLNDDIRPMVRVGIAMGEVILADGTVTGEGVVLAQRVEQLAQPGAVCITGAIREALPQRMPFDQQDLGEQPLKGFDEAVRVYTVQLKKGAELPEPGDVHGMQRARVRRWACVAAVLVVAAGALLAWFEHRAPDFTPASADRMAFPLPDKPSIAVLPFVNHSDEAKLDYFASGLTENITSALSKAPGLFVIARNSAATYEGKPVNVSRVAEDLGIRYVLEGSVQKSGNRLRITSQLLDAVNGRHLWADRFDRDARDVFAVQDEITKRVVTELQVELTLGEHARMSSGGTHNLDAWLLRLEAYGEFIKFTRESQTRARELYQAAHEADPDWAAPIAGIAFTHWYEARLGWSDSRDESIRLATAAARRAIELEPDEPIGYMALGNIMFLIDDPERAIELRQKAIKLAPNSFVALAGLAIRLAELERHREAIELFERAIRLSPKHPWWVDAGYGLALHLAGRGDEAVETYKKGIRSGTQNVALRGRLAAVYADLGQLDEARSTIADALRVDPQFTVAAYMKSYAFPSAERNTWYKDLLLKSGLPERATPSVPDKPSIAVLPFTNLSDDPEQDYFADGITEDLITDLSKVSGLLVVSRSSVYRYKGDQSGSRRIGQNLGVKYVLEGSVRRAGDRLRVNVTLIDTGSEFHLWADRYDRDMGEVFQLQDDLTLNIVRALKLELSASERGRIERPDTASSRAYDLVLKARAIFRRWNPETNAQVMELYEQAIELDPEFAQAWAEYGHAHFQKWVLGGSLDNGVLQRGVELARKATEIDSQSPFAWMEYGFLGWWADRSDESIKALRRAVELDPHYADGWSRLSEVLTFAGRPGEGLDAIREARRHTHIAEPYWFGFYAGEALFYLDRHEDAVTELNHAIDLHPNFFPTRRFLAAVLSEMAQTDAAREQIKKVLELNPRLTLSTLKRQLPFSDPKDLERQLAALRNAGLPE